MRRHSVYESWNLGSSAALPQRTYYMRPLGIGSMLVESMTGYIARLAEAHDVSPAMLLKPRTAATNGIPFWVAGHSEEPYISLPVARAEWRG